MLGALRAETSGIAVWGRPTLVRCEGCSVPYEPRLVQPCLQGSLGALRAETEREPYGVARVSQRRRRGPRG